MEFYCTRVKKGNLQDKRNTNELWQSGFAACERKELEENEGGEPLN